MAKVSPARLPCKTFTRAENDTLSTNNNWFYNIVANVSLIKHQGLHMLLAAAYLCQERQPGLSVASRWCQHVILWSQWCHHVRR